jgi:Tfp pilus assembly protein PilO
MTTAQVDVARLIRIVTVALAILAGALVYFSAQSDIDALGARLDETRAELHSDDVTFAELAALRAERDALRGRYARALADSGEAVFLRDLATTARRHRTRVVSTSAAANAPPAQRADTTIVATGVEFTIELHGTYRDLLACIVDLSRQHALVRVRMPSIRRTGDSLDASLPVTLYEPALGAS